jgi:uncharacterized membrane protein
MATKILEFLLGIDRIHLGEGGRIVLTFLAGWPGWVVFLALLAAACYVVFIYLKDGRDAPPWPRGFLMFLRFAVIALAVLMVQEPALKLERNEVIRSSVAVLVDRSASMTIADTVKDEERKIVDEALRRGTVAPEKPGQPTRYDLAQAALKLDQAAALKRLAAEQRIYLYGFDESLKLVGRIDNPEMVGPVLAELADKAPEGKRTMPTRSLEMVLEQLAGQTLTGVLLVSDGRSTVPGDTKKIEELARTRDIPFFTLGLGSTELPKDVELRRATAERRAFVNEDFPVTVELSNTGFAGSTVKLHLVVKGHPDLNVTQDVKLLEAGRKQTVEIRFKPPAAGSYELQVQAEPLPGEFDPKNNTSVPLPVNVLDRKLKVLLVEDLPRWEYKYLSTALYRDPTVQVSLVLNSADTQFVPEGTLPIRAFPPTRDQLFAYDVLIIGDVDRRMFSSEQLAWINEFVRVKGGGLILIAGDRFFNPNSYVGTPLEALVPVEVQEEQVTGTVAESFTPAITVEGSVSPILRFEKDYEENRQAWKNLPGFYWFYRAKGIKPGAQTLLEHPEEKSQYADTKYPLLVLQRVGAGQVFFSATDETWRWRFYTGRKYFNNFWLQLIRHLALPQEPASIETESLRYTLGERAKIQLRVADPESVKDLAKVKVTVKYEPDETLKEKGREEQITLERANPRLALFEGEYVPERPGKYTLTSEVPTNKAKITAAGDFQVAASREEFLVPTRDADYLAKVAAFNGGSEVGLLDIGKFAGLLRNKSRVVPNDLTDEIWDSPLALGLFILLIGTEWILRKKYRML